ncbi:putative transmembrane protein [Apostichopus japonicus]|uniref:Putative transmembrane protein n=1 Tax=Stichopus japonicus TaxID=307972 RepID=A0A2G8K8R6_STIJA|nr:putative transmembrane protein [Apostichopus japonicus]
MASVSPTSPVNADYIRLMFNKSSVVVKSVCVGVVFLYFISIFVDTDSFLNALSVTPGLIFPPGFHFWSLVTHQFVEIHIWFVIIDFAFVLLCGKLLEPIWGALEMLLFFVIVTAGSAICSSVVYVFLYLATFNVEYLFHTHLYGLSAYIVGVTVALKQSIGDHELPPLGLKLRVKDLPLIVVMVSIVMRLLGLVPGSHPCLIITGFMVSWVYLRFYQKLPNAEGRGDMADSFNFASFFPEVVRPPISLAANTVHSFLVKIKVCKKQIRKYDVGAPSSITINLPGTDPADAERRRKIALDALKERLSRVEEQTQWPSMDEASPASPATSTSSTVSKEKVSAETEIASNSSSTAPSATSPDQSVTMGT